MESKCNRCGLILDEIRYVEPDWTSKRYEALLIRPPLCESCWDKAVKERERRIL